MPTMHAKMGKQGWCGGLVLQDSSASKPHLAAVDLVALLQISGQRSQHQDVCFITIVPTRWLFQSCVMVYTI
jgi:hypothetical protein